VNTPKATTLRAICGDQLQRRGTNADDSPVSTSPKSPNPTGASLQSPEPADSDRTDKPPQTLVLDERADGSHERIETDRRLTDRRAEPRRQPEVRQRRQARDFGRIGTTAAALGAVVGIWALINAPVTKSATVCTDTFGGELLHHREIHPLWIASMMLCALALALPTKPRRSYVSVGLVGLTFGLAVAAYIRVATWKTGICFV
jgi:hypothetical protein